MGAALKQIDAGVSNVGYAEAGPATGPAVILLHGWPYDIHSFVDVAPDIVVGGLPGDRPVWARLWYHAFSFQRNVPEWPASGTCRDVIALMDALKIQKAILAGFDWADDRPTSSRSSGRIGARPSSP